MERLIPNILYYLIEDLWFLKYYIDLFRESLEETNN